MSRWTLYYNKFVSLSRARQIAFIVFGFHFFCVFLLCVQHFIVKEKPKTKMVVRTTTLQPSIQTKSVAIPPSPKISKQKKPALPNPKEIPAPKKTEDPKLKNTQVVSSKDIKSGKEKPVDQSVVKELESHLASFEKEEVFFSGSTPLSLPKTLQAASKEESYPVVDFEYGEVLVSFLQNTLDLPEFGEVVIDLDVDPRGRLVRFDILEAKSRKNGEFLKKRLPELVLPCFNDPEKSNAVRNFTITFKNATNL